MSTNSELMRKLMEASAHTGTLDHPDVSYSSESKKGEITKVIANLQSYQSGKYTRLGRNLKRIEWLSDKVAALKEQVKGETKEMIADLFHAEDACRTRVVETVSFTFELTKDPKATETVQYAKVLKELEEHLTPELVQVMESLKAKYSSTTQKSAALKATDARESVELDEGILDGLRAFFAKFLQKITAWGIRYDDKLNSLKAQVHVHEQVMLQSQPAALDETSDDSEQDLVAQFLTRVTHALLSKHQGVQVRTPAAQAAANKQFDMQAEGYAFTLLMRQNNSNDISEAAPGYHDNPINMLFDWIYAHSDDLLADMGFEVIGGAAGRVGVRHMQTGEQFTIAVTKQG